MRASLTKVLATLATLTLVAMLLPIWGGDAAGALVYPATEVTPPYPQAPGQSYLSWLWQNSVLVVGDSLCASSMAGNAGTTNWTTDVFGPSWYRYVVVDCKGGMPIKTSVPGTPDGLTELQNQKAAGGAPPTVVLELGTNDDWQAEGGNGLGFIYLFQAMINEAEALNPNEQVYVVNYNTIDGVIPRIPDAQGNLAFSPANSATKDGLVNLVMGIDEQNGDTHLHLVNFQAESSSWQLCPGDTPTSANGTGAVTYTTPITAPAGTLSDATPCFVDGVHGDEAFFLDFAELIANAVG